MVRSDYGVPVGDGTSDLPGSLAPRARPCPSSAAPASWRGSAPLMPRPRARDAASRCWRRAGLGQEPPGARVRGQAAAEEGALVLYGACDAVVRTPYGPFVEALDRLVRAIGTERAARRARRRRRRAGPPAARAARPGRRACRRRSQPTPTPSATACTPRSTDLLAGVGRGGRCCSCSRTCHWADAPTLLLLRHLARAAGDARLLLLATFRDTEADCRGRSPRRWPTCAAPTTSCDCGSAGSPQRRSPSSSAAPPAASRARGCASWRRRSSDLTEGNAFLVCELWRALVETGAVEVTAGQAPHSPARSTSSAPPRACARWSASGSPGSPRARSTLLELAATAGRGVRARADPPRRRPRRARASRRARGGGGQRDDRGAAVPAARLPLHPRAGAPGAL